MSKKPPTKLSESMWRALPATSKRGRPPSAQVLWRGRFVPVRIVPDKGSSQEGDK